MEIKEEYTKDIVENTLADYISQPLKRNRNSTMPKYNRFFPIDDKGFGNERRRHNYHFTVEI